MHRFLTICIEYPFRVTVYTLKHLYDILKLILYRFSSMKFLYIAKQSNNINTTWKHVVKEHAKWKKINDPFFTVQCTNLIFFNPKFQEYEKTPILLPIPEIIS